MMFSNDNSWEIGMLMKIGMLMDMAMLMYLDLAE